MQKQTQFWRPNINGVGRMVRLVAGLLTLAAGICLGVYLWWWLGLLVALGGGFMIFEAARGWCLLRAWQIRTRF